MTGRQDQGRQAKEFQPVHRSDADFAEMRLARQREDRFTLIFLAAATGVAGLIAAVAIAIAFSAWPVNAHEALPTAAEPQGWSYPFSCCSGYDCREVPSKAIGERREGYVIKGTGEVIAYSDARLKNSPDGDYHWCSVAGADNSRTICLFVPPRSY